MGVLLPDDSQPAHICKYPNSLVCDECGKSYVQRLFEGLRAEEQERDCGD